MMQLTEEQRTAQPVYQFIVNNPDTDGYIEWADCNPDYFSKEPSDRRRILYSAPPVAATAAPDGWKLAPMIAFRSQWAAGQKAFFSAGMNKIDAVYKAMVAAAPSPPYDL